jgi:hypothetical protein
MESLVDATMESPLFLGEWLLAINCVSLDLLWTADALRVGSIYYITSFGFIIKI